MDFSIVLCTRNHAEELARALLSFTRLRIPSGASWELIVVDNGSIDSSASVIQSFEQKLPIRRIFEAEAGLSNARNAGVAAARGTYIIWTDDDVLVHEDWLCAYAGAFRLWPGASVFGGKIIPSLQPPLPEWILDSFNSLKNMSAARREGGEPIPLPIETEGVAQTASNRSVGAEQKFLELLKQMFAARDLGNRPVSLSVEDDRIPWGANYAIRAVEQKSVLYNPELGRAPGRNRGGEETELIRSLLMAGHTGWWVPESKVFHIIPSSRQTLGAALFYCEGLGEDWAHLAEKEQGLTLSGIPLYLWFKMPFCYLRFRLASLFRLKSQLFYLQRLAWYRGVFKYHGKEMPFRLSRDWQKVTDSAAVRTK